MLITRLVTYNIENPNHKRFYEDLHELINGRNISFGTLVDGVDQNISGRMIDVPNTGVINTEFVVIHNLDRIPLFYDVKYINVIGTVYDSGTPWTNVKAFFKCSIANAHVRLFVH